jgi:hypothetical protein
MTLPPYPNGQPKWLYPKYLGISPHWEIKHVQPGIIALTHYPQLRIAGTFKAFNMSLEVFAIVTEAVLQPGFADVHAPAQLWFMPDWLPAFSMQFPFVREFDLHTTGDWTATIGGLGYRWGGTNLSLFEALSIGMPIGKPVGLMLQELVELVQQASEPMAFSPVLAPQGSAGHE